MVAVIEQLLGGEAAWYLQPYLALLGALIVLTAWQLARAPHAKRQPPRR